MPRGSTPAHPGQDGDPAREPHEPVPGPDPVTEEEWLAWCAATADLDEPPDPDDCEPDPDGLPGAWEYDLEQVVAECRRITAEEAAACARAARMGLLGGQPVGLERRGPGQRLSTGAGGQRGLVVALDPIATGECDHRYEARGHDPGVKLRHLTQVRYATCTGPGCRRPSTQADFEHNIPYQAGGRSCLCNGGPLCKR